MKSREGLVVLTVSAVIRAVSWVSIQIRTWRRAPFKFIRIMDSTPTHRERHRSSRILAIKVSLRKEQQIRLQA